MSSNCYNILLLGETGVGKSTLINAFANYMAYPTFAEAVKGQEICIIPTKFDVFGKDSTIVTIQTNDEKDANECLEDGQSATQSCKSYVFNIKDGLKVRWIDSSGFADTSGVDKDEQNVNDIIEYILQFNEIHAIAIVTKIDQKQFSGQFEECFTKIVDILNAADLKNVIFICTHGEKPAGATLVLKNLLQNMEKNLKVEIKVKPNKSNVYCFENQPFRDLMAAKRNHPICDKGIENTWKKSTQTFQHLLKDVVKKPPFQCSAAMFNILINFIGDFIIIASEVLLDIHQNKQTLTQLQQSSKVNTNFYRLKLIKHTRGTSTICLGDKCLVKYKSDDGSERITHGKACCFGCEPFYGLLGFCQAFSRPWGKCKSCKCETKYHILVFHQLSTAQLEEMELNALQNSLEERQKYFHELKGEEDSILRIIQQLTTFTNCMEKVTSKQKIIINRLKSMVINSQGRDERGQKSNVLRPILKESDLENVQHQLSELKLYGSAFEVIINKIKTENKRDEEINVVNKVFT